jgi:uncharacterized membrane protein YkvA (DUF1232 family)
MNAPWKFTRYLTLAQRMLVQGRLPTLLVAVARKGDKQGGRFGALKENLSLLQALCLAWWRGEYRTISPQALLAAVAGLLYFLSPMDAVPDWLVALGLLDDLAVLAWVMRTWRSELESFRSWRAAQPPERLRVLERLPPVDELQSGNHLLR